MAMASMASSRLISAGPRAWGRHQGSRISQASAHAQAGGGYPSVAGSVLAPATRGPVEGAGVEGLRASKPASRVATWPPARDLRCRGVATSEITAVPSDPESRKLIEQVVEGLAREYADLPLGPYGRDDEALVWWFLRDRKFEVEETVTKLCKAIRWRHEFGVANLKPEDVAQEAATGKAYLHEHPDFEGRPVIVVAAAKHFPDSSRLVASQQLCVYLIEQALTRLPPGEERFLGIFDLRGFTASNADIQFVGFLINAFFNYYPKRLHRVLFVDAPPIFQPGWRLMKPMLKSYASLVEFVSADDVREKHFLPGKAPAAFHK